MVKKGIFCLCMTVLILGGCTLGGVSLKGKEKLAEPDFVLTYAENQAEDYPTTQGAYKFAELVKERTGGKVEILVNAGGMLGDERSVIEQIQFGGIDFARVALSTAAEYIPKLNVLQMPYLYTGADHMWKVLEGPIGDEFLEAFQGSGILALSWYDAGARNFYSSRQPIEKVEDMKGMKVRVQDSALMERMIQLLGAIPVPLDYDQVYSAFQTDEIDAAENNWPSYESMNHEEVAGYYTKDEHSRVPEVQLASRVTWERLTKEDQEMIRQCAEESARYERTLWEDRSRNSEEIVRRNGCVVIELSSAEKARFQAAVTPIYHEFCKNYMDIIERIKEEGRLLEQEEAEP